PTILNLSPATRNAEFSIGALPSPAMRRAPSNRTGPCCAAVPDTNAAASKRAGNTRMNPPSALSVRKQYAIRNPFPGQSAELERDLLASHKFAAGLADFRGARRGSNLSDQPRPDLLTRI